MTTHARCTKHTYTQTHTLTHTSSHKRIFPESKMMNENVKQQQQQNEREQKYSTQSECRRKKN